MNVISIDKSSYKNENKFWSDITKLLKILTDNDYELSFRLDDCDIYVIEFDYNKNKGFGNDGIRWISDEEYDGILMNRFPEVENV